MDPSSNVHHQYGTRIRQNSLLKPSARLRQVPDLPPSNRRLKPVPTLTPSPNSPLLLPPFPPSNVTLHPDDVNSKVFIAIGRSFLSVDNRAMTVKDLAEMTLKFGLVCHNVSAAGQAITTYIRTHMQRCDAQDDHPLLLRHVLSGTPSDDDLLPALHSRTGGAHCTVNAESRSTNFRRGTMVWYLSRATGAPCPFARAGIRLCDYSENGKIGIPIDSKERKRERDRERRQEQCGQKRKRLLRGCADKASECESGEEDDDDEEEEVENRPPKVKLTLRLKPRLSPSSSASISAHSEDVIDLSKEADLEDPSDEPMSVDIPDVEELAEPMSEHGPVFPLYPRRSVSIPCYAPSSSDPPCAYFPTLASPFSAGGIEAFRRSPSIPISVASPPPDSEDEDEFLNTRPFSQDRLPSPADNQSDDWDLDFDSEDDGDNDIETQWESPGPRSPSAPLSNDVMAHVVVKQEPRDVQDMLDAWEDIDGTATDAKVVEVVAKAAAGMFEADSTSKVKIEELEMWNWDSAYNNSSPDWFGQTIERDAVHVKQEEEEPILTSPIPFDQNASSPVSPLSSVSSPSSSFYQCLSPINQAAMRRHSELAWKDVELLGPDSIHPQEFEEGWQGGTSRSGTLRARAKTSPNLHMFISKPPAGSSSPRLEHAMRPQHSFVEEPGRSVISTSASTKSCIEHSALRLSSSAQTSFSQTHNNADEDVNDVVVVNTCQPCTPVVSATQVEGISVYQMTLGSMSLLRRIDTDFVNLSPIIQYLGIPSPPLTATPSAAVVSNSSPTVTGTWVPLTTAQSFVKGRPLPTGLLDVFLSDNLFERFPPALQDFHRSNAPGRLLNKFGPHFKSTVDQRHSSQLTIRTEVPYRGERWDIEPVSVWDAEDHLLLIQPPAGLTHALCLPSTDVSATIETPLSATEQEMFRTLCVIPDWDKESSSPREDVTFDDTPPTTPSSPSLERPLRRSKRVANAVAARARTHSRRRSARNSLS